jgi:hypothetical protein
MPPSISLATGSCRACGHAPVAFGARSCPICGAANPNPGIGDRYGGRGAVYGLVAGILVGSVWGYLGFHVGLAGAFGGALIGALVGLVFGLIGGWFMAIVAWLSGVR